jgi:hypothetical protein
MTELQPDVGDTDRRPRFRELAAEAIKYWEPRRLVYNLVLAAVVVSYFALAWPKSEAFLSVNFALMLFLLAVVANVCYCAAYVVDIFVQLSSVRALWLRKRWLLFLLGMMFAAVITRFFALVLFLGTP